jgi:hypothetical protein
MGYTLLIDNYDSFTWNIYADIATLGGNPLVRRNDKISIEDIEVSDNFGFSGETATNNGTRPCTSPEILTGYASPLAQDTRKQIPGLVDRRSFGVWENCRFSAFAWVSNVL